MKKTSKTKKTTAKRAPQPLANASLRRVEDYAVPGGLVLGAGIATATGILFRKQLGTVARLAAAIAVREGVAARRLMDGGNLLASIGLQKRRPALRIAEAGLGAFGGLVAGSVLGLWVARDQSRRAPAKLAAQTPGALRDSAGREPSNSPNNSFGGAASSHA